MSGLAIHDYNYWIDRQGGRHGLLLQLSYSDQLTSSRNVKFLDGTVLSILESVKQCLGLFTTFHLTASSVLGVHKSQEYCIRQHYPYFILLVCGNFAR